MTANESGARKLLLIGLDGATFDVLDDWIEDGSLPVLQRLKQNGAWGNLASTNPPTTPPAWSSCVTGLNPGRHGIFDFTVSPLQDPNRPLVSSASVRGMKLWRVFNRFGWRAVVVNVPITFPAERIDGVMVSGMMTPSRESPFVYPPEYKPRLDSSRGPYIPNVDIAHYETSEESGAVRFLDDLHECLLRRREAVLRLLQTESWEFCMVVLIAMDRIQHLFFKYLKPVNELYYSPKAGRLRQRIREEFVCVDRIVGEIMAAGDENTTTMVVSDHGFGATEAYFNVNTWLLKLGYLKVAAKPYFSKQMFHAALQLEESEAVQRLLPSRVRFAVKQRIRRGRSSLSSARLDLAAVIDWRRTRAFFASIPTQGIYINERAADGSGVVEKGEEATELKKELTARLLELRDPTTKERLVDAVWPREELYHGPATVYAPHLLFKLKDYAVLGRQHLGARSLFWRCGRLPIGFHRSNGIFLATGPGIRAGEAKDLRIQDVMPTGLYAVRMPVPEGLDGRIREDIFDPEFRASSPVEFFKSEEPASEAPAGAGDYDAEERQIVTERLRSLGYLE